MERKDGRDNLSMRKIKVEFNVLDQCDGSCKLTQGKTIVIAGVIGPADTSPIYQHPTQCSVKVDFSSPYFEKKQNFHHSVFIKRCFEKIILRELYPQRRLMMTVLVLSDEGCALSVGINALTFALMLAGVNMKGLILSVGVGVTSKKEIIIDPLSDESEMMKKSCIVLNSSKDHPGLIGMYNPGEKESFESEEVLLVCLASAREAMKRIKEFVRECMKNI